MPLIFRKAGSGGSSGSGGSVPILPNADTLSKFSTTPTGELVFDGKIIGGITQTFENADTLNKFSVNEKGELTFNGEVVDKTDYAGILDKFSENENGDLLFNGKVIKEHEKSTAQTFDNAEILDKLSENENGELVFNGKVIGNNCNCQKSAEVTHYVTLEKGQTQIELPGDCDTSQAITVSINGLAVDEHVFWEVIEKSYPEKDLIAWNGLELETLAQEGDKIMITYYRKV